MALDHYTTAAKVRQLDSMISAEVDSTSEFSDTVINNVTDNHTQPIIDSWLGNTYTVPFTEADDSGILAAIAAKISASIIISGDVAQFAGGADPEKATRLMEVAEKWLQEIVDGKKHLNFSRTTNALDIEYDDDPLTRPANEQIAGDEWMWRTNAEERSSS